jgi:hypothetical protein
MNGYLVSLSNVKMPSRAEQLYDETERLARDYEWRCAQTQTMGDDMSVSSHANILIDRFSEVANLAMKTDRQLHLKTLERVKFCKSPKNPTNGALRTINAFQNLERVKESRKMFNHLLNKSESKIHPFNCNKIVLISTIMKVEDFSGNYLD